MYVSVMLSYQDLSEDEQEQAVSQAQMLLSTEGEGTPADAIHLAKKAFYPEEDDVILFLLDDDSNFETITADLDEDMGSILDSPLARSVRNRNDAAA